MKKLLISAISAVALTGTAMAAAPVDTSKHRQVVNELLNERGVSAWNVDRIAVEPIVGPRSVLRGVLATVWVDQCADGYLVVRMTDAGVVKSAYTRDGCSIPNFPAQ